MTGPKVFAGWLLLASVIAPVHAAPPIYLNHSIIVNIPKADLPSFRAAVNQALNDSADGQTTHWTSSAQRGHAPVSVALTPSQTTQTQKADRCRMLQGRFTQSGGKEDWSFWFCRQPEGNWKASSH